MPDDRTEEEHYDWLYAGHAGRDGPRQDGDATDKARRSAAGTVSPDTRPIEPVRSDERDEPERTQVLGVGPEAPPSTPGTDKPTTFGGTYAAPTRRSDEKPRFATPASPQQAPSRPTEPPSSTRPQPPGKRPRRRRKWWVIGIVSVLVAWILFLVLVPVWAWSKISKVDAEPSGDRPADTPGTTYLLVGSDARKGVGGARTDTILLLHIPDGGGPDLLLSIPRDSYVDIPDHGKNKINAAFAFGGPKLLVQTVEDNTGIRVDDYIEIGFTGFVDVVDAVGGIEVCPKTAVNDSKAGHLKLHKGCQEVDGQTALGYSRSRAFPLGDITRTEHQREVISKVGKEAASWSTILLPWRYFSVNKAAAESLRIGENVGPLDLVQFAWAMAHSGDAKRCVVPFSSLGTTTNAGSSVIWDEAKAKALFAKIRADDTAGAVCNSGQRR
ncbi:MAG TPA: LCP family protein [Nocardioidaceae bacterium]